MCWLLSSLGRCITSLCWRPDGKAIAVGLEDGTISLHDVEVGSVSVFFFSVLFPLFFRTLEKALKNCRLAKITYASAIVILVIDEFFIVVSNPWRCIMVEWEVVEKLEVAYCCSCVS